MYAQMQECESMHVQMWGGLLQDTVSPMDDTVRFKCQRFGHGQKTVKISRFASCVVKRATTEKGCQQKL
jgi:hypothetical protein